MIELLKVPVVELFYICLPILGLLIVIERLYRAKKLKPEEARKIIHIGTGVFIAFLPFYVGYSVIQYLSVALLAIILLSYKVGVFSAVHSVKRLTIGEILYPIGIGICAFLEPAPWIFTAAVLHLAVADGLAAVAGVKWGKHTRYNVLSHGKSLIGSMTFFYISMAIFASSLFFVSPESRPDLLILLIACPLGLTLLENISWFGTDNITVPVSVIILLSTL